MKGEPLGSPIFELRSHLQFKLHRDRFLLRHYRLVRFGVANEGQPRGLQTIE